MSVDIRISIMQVLVSHPENVCLISGYKLYKTLKNSSQMCFFFLLHIEFCFVHAYQKF